MASSSSRSGLYICLLTLGIFIGFVLIFVFDSKGGYGADQVSAQNDFVFSRILTSLLFLLVYFFALFWIVYKKPTSIEFLWWYPSVLGGSYFLVFLAVSVLFFIKNFSAENGIGNAGWQEIIAALAGATSLLPAIGFVMIITPFLIPLEIPKMEVKHVESDEKRDSDRYPVLEHYKDTNEFHQKQPPQVIMAEDDILHATFLLEFFETASLPCLHVATADAAMDALTYYEPSIKLVICDNFLRTSGNSSQLKTGSDLVKAITQKYPNRNFRLILISGLSFPSDTLEFVDAAFEKPLKMYEFQHQLQTWEIGSM